VDLAAFLTDRAQDAGELAAYVHDGARSDETRGDYDEQHQP